MGTFDVVEALGKFPLLTYLGAVDLIDRLNFILTFVMLVLSSLIVTFREYMMDPITCYMATNPGGENLLKYMENYCWVQGTMSLTNKKIPVDAEWDKFLETRIVYYQWVPLMFFIQAAMFFIPHMVWLIVCSHLTGLNLSQFMSQKLKYVEVEMNNNSDRLLNSNDRGSSDDDEDSKQPIIGQQDNQTIKAPIKLKYSVYTQQLLEMFVQHREWRHGRLHDTKLRIQKRVPIIPSKRYSNWIVFFYFITKILYFINSIGQLYLMQYFLQLHETGSGYSSNFGIELLRHITSGRSWELTGAFPRVAYCMAKVKHTGGHNIQVAQCVLSANLFIEKIYIFLWFWIVFLCVANILSIFIWVKRLVLRKKDIKKYLRLRSINTYNNDKDLMQDFCDQFLQIDGSFLLQMMALNLGDVIVGPVVAELFKIWRRINTGWPNKGKMVNGVSINMGSSSNSTNKWKEDHEVFQLIDKTNHL